MAAIVVVLVLSTALAVVALGVAIAKVVANDSCDPIALQGKMTVCQMNLVNGSDDFCSRYAAYTKCTVDLLLVHGCGASAQGAYSSAIESATAAYSSQLATCSS